MKKAHGRNGEVLMEAKGGVGFVERGTIKPGVVETKDLWQGAYILSEGGQLEDVRIEIKRNGRKEVIFVLKDSKVEYLMHRFDSGGASCNVTKLRGSMNHLKDIISRRTNR